MENGHGVYSVALSANLGRVDFVRLIDFTLNGGAFNPMAAKIASRSQKTLMPSQLLQRLDHGARLTLPFITTALCTLLGVIAWPLPHFGMVAPPLALMALYYWTIHRPDLFHPSMAFAIGLLNDVVNFLPLGLSAFLFVAAHQIILRRRRLFASHSFFMIWSGFILTVLGVMMSEWIFLCLIRWQSVPILPVLAQMTLAMVFFPIPCWLFIKMQRLALTHI